MLCVFSVHSAYCSAIHNAKGFVFIENQFFVSAQDGDTVVGNRVAAVLCDRIIRAAEEQKPFKVRVRMLWSEFGSCDPRQTCNKRQCCPAVVVVVWSSAGLCSFDGVKWRRSSYCCLCCRHLTAILTATPCHRRCYLVRPRNERVFLERCHRWWWQDEPQ